MTNEMTSDVRGAPVSVAFLESGVVIVTRNEPPNNFLSVESLHQLSNALIGLNDDARCRVILLRTEGKNFCAGANFASEPRESGAKKRLDTTELYHEALRLFEVKKPIVAIMQGAAIGGGLGLGLACDFRVASEESRFSANFAQLGFHQGFGLSVTLPRTVGQQSAWELLFSGRRIGGKEALDIGLCDRLVPRDHLETEGMAFATSLASSGPLAVLAIRATMREGLVEQVGAALVHEAKVQAKLATTSDFREGVRASAERRPPNFTGT